MQNIRKHCIESEKFCPEMVKGHSESSCHRDQSEEAEELLKWVSLRMKTPGRRRILLIRVGIMKAIAEDDNDGTVKQ